MIDELVKHLASCCTWKLVVISGTTHHIRSLSEICFCTPSLTNYIYKLKMEGEKYILTFIYVN